jgi:hypothetical protein
MAIITGGARKNVSPASIRKGMVRLLKKNRPSTRIGLRIDESRSVPL